MKNVTISLSDDLATRVRLAAAREGKSLSKFIAEHLSRALDGHPDPLTPFDRWLSGPGWAQDGGPQPLREDLHDRAVLRGYEYPDLPARPERSAEARADEA